MMQTTVKKSDNPRQTTEKVKREKTSKDDTTKTSPDEKLKKGPYTISTPRNFVQKSTTADIYGQKKKSVHSAKAPKKTSTAVHATSNVSPMTDLLKSSPSSSSQISTSRATKMKTSARKMDTKVAAYSVSTTPRSNFNVTVNSPIAKRKLNMDREKSFTKVASDKSTISTGQPAISTKKTISTGKPISTKDSGRQRTKTRTLDENEVKILTPEAVDINAEMLNLTKTLAAKPKAFFIDLDGEPSKPTKTEPSKTASDDEVSYEDDFESYESDFDSYHSSSPSDKMDGEQSGDDDKAGVETTAKEKDEERMLDSGNFDLREQRSAQKSKPAVMDFIVEASEDLSEDKRVSLTDEGFQEMSSCSAVSSMKTVHVDVLYRPLFIDFSKSKENKRKKRINERLKQRAKDLLSIITLHEMSYNLFEMKPISYDLYMATFGRSNYTQIAVQTFEDGITQEVQTDEVECEQKWTQHPVEFSKSDICLSGLKESRKYSQNTEDFLTKFTFLTRQTTDVDINNMINLDENYKTNPLRVYLEQKDGAGPNEMLPYETYKSKLVENKYNTHRLGKFLKRMQSRISHILNSNKGNSELTDLNKVSKFPFSKGYVSISTKNIEGNKVFLKNTKIAQVYFSDTKSNLFMTVHSRPQNVTVKKTIICLWDISVAKQEPLKILTAIDDVVMGRFRGSTDGFFVAVLEDSSIHLWDLSEEPIWRDDVASDDKTTKLVENNSKGLTDIERDRLNNQVVLDQNEVHCALQACAYTSSAHNMSSGVAVDCIVGLELLGDSRAVLQDGGRKVVGQIVSLQRTGTITIWTIVQDKFKSQPDIGKAFSSKMKLERNQIIPLLDYIDAPQMVDLQNGDKISNFNLNSAKRRLTSRKHEKNMLKIDNSRPKSAVSSEFEFDIDRPSSARKKGLPVKKNVLEMWETGILCYDLKIMCWKNDNNYLVARNCGEVLCCRKNIGAVKVDRICVANDMSSVTCIEVSPHGLPYYLAATDTGTINLCSLRDNRVLLTLDCRNIPNQEMERCQSDHKGRFVSSVQTRLNLINIALGSKMLLTSLSWSRVNPCCLFATLEGAVVAWELTHSDINAKYACERAACVYAAADNTLALLTPDGEVQIHRLTNEQRTNEYLHIFEKYIALL